jgi:hypothetical protein
MWKAALPLGVDAVAAAWRLLEISTAGMALLWLFSIVWWAISIGSVVLRREAAGPEAAAR